MAIKLRKTVKAILNRRDMISKAQKPYVLYRIQLTDGTEVNTVTEFAVGDEVQAWYDEKYDTIKVKHAPKAL